MTNNASGINILGKHFKGFLLDLTTWGVAGHLEAVSIEVDGETHTQADSWLTTRSNDLEMASKTLDEAISDDSQVVITEGGFCDGPIARPLEEHFKMWQEGAFARGTTAEDGEFFIALRVTDARALLMAARQSESASEEQTFLCNGMVDVTECLRTLIAPNVPGCEIFDTGFTGTRKGMGGAL